MTSATDSYDVAVTQEQGFLRIRASGTRSLGAMEALLERVRTESRERAARCVLIDAAQVVGPLPFVQWFLVGGTVAKLLIQEPIKLAVLSTADGASPFAGVVADNRGKRFGVFAAEDEALAWLLASH
jgi:hypothetical protein